MKVQRTDQYLLRAGGYCVINVTSACVLEFDAIHQDQEPRRQLVARKGDVMLHIVKIVTYSSYPPAWYYMLY